MVLCRSGGSWGLGSDSHCYPGLDLHGVAFMDDGVLWQQGGERLASRLQHLSDVLRTWGLQLNAEKCKVYRSPHASQDAVMVDGKVIPEVEELQVMGLPFKVGATASELIASPLAMARAKFWKLQHLFKNHTSIKARVKLFDRIVTPCALWCAAALIPDKTSLQLVNRHLVRFVVWMMHVRRRPGERWLEHHLRERVR